MVYSTIKVYHILTLYSLALFIMLLFMTLYSYIICPVRVGAIEISQTTRIINSEIMNMVSKGYIDTLLVNEALMAHWGMIMYAVACIGAHMTNL